MGLIHKEENLTTSLFIVIVMLLASLSPLTMASSADDSEISEFSSEGLKSSKLPYENSEISESSTELAIVRGDRLASSITITINKEVEIGRASCRDRVCDYV